VYQDYENLAARSSADGVDNSAAGNVIRLPAEAVQPAGEQPPEGLVLSHDEMIEDQPFFVEGLFRPGATVMLHGASRSGKTLTAAYLCACVQTGSSFLGRKVNARRGVLWVASEKPDEAAKRLRAAELRQGGDSNLRGLYPLKGRNLSDQQTRRAAIEAARYADDHFRCYFGVGLGLIVIDTLNRGFELASEFDAAEAARVFAICDEVKAALPDAPALMLTHHEAANGSRPRGSTAYTANPDVCIRTHHNGEGLNSRFRHLALTKPQDGADEGPIGRLTFTRETLPSGVCADAIVPAKGRPAAKGQPKALGKAAKADRSDDDIKAAVLEAIRGGTKARDLPRAVKVARGRCQRATAELLAAGKLVKDPETRRILAA
jgi:hypothetical protein